MTASGEKKSLGIKDPRQKTLEAKMHGSNAFGASIRRQVPVKKSVPSIERREIGGEAVSVHLFCILVFRLSIDGHFVNHGTDKYLLSIY